MPTIDHNRYYADHRAEFGEDGLYQQFEDIAELFGEANGYFKEN